MKAKKTIAVLAAATALAGVATGTASADRSAAAITPAGVALDAVRSQAPRVWRDNWVECVSQIELQGLSGARDTVGLYEYGTIYLHYGRVCKPLARYNATGELTYGAAAALLTVYHEVQHARGTVNERTAECKGARMTLKELEKRGESSGVLEEAHHYLFVELDEYRPSQYDLIGFCS